MTDRSDELEPLLDQFDGDAVLLVVLRDPGEDGGMRQQSVIGKARPDSLSRNILGRLAERVQSILSRAFESAGVTTDFVERT